MTVTLNTSSAFPNAVSVSADMHMMHSHYGVHEAVANLSPEHLNEFLSFRFRFLQEEVNEGMKAILERNPEEVCDALIDLVVIAVGTLDLFNVNFDQAWKEVLKANMNKRVGVKASRPNPWGLPDLVKPTDFKNPDHSNNVGLIGKIFENDM